MVRIVIKGEVYERVAIANIIAGGRCHIVYGDEHNDLNVKNFDFEDIDEWVVTREGE